MSDGHMKVWPPVSLETNNDAALIAEITRLRAEVERLTREREELLRPRSERDRMFDAEAWDGAMDALGKMMQKRGALAARLAEAEGLLRHTGLSYCFVCLADAPLHLEGCRLVAFLAAGTQDGKEKAK